MNKKSRVSTLNLNRSLGVSYRIFKISAIVICALNINILIASERVRIYDIDKGVHKYSGYAEKQADNSIRFYDKYGNFTGRIQDERLISKDGKVKEKLYLKYRD